MALRTDTVTTTPTRSLPLRALEDLLNKAIAADPVSQARLAKLAGRHMSVRLQPPGLTMSLQWLPEGRLQLQPEVAPEQPDLDLRASPGALLGQLMRALSGQSPQASGMQIAGDAELARVLAEVARHYRPDPSGLLSPLFGDVIGQSIAEGLAGAARFARRGLQRLADGGSEYLREEAQVLITASEQAELIDGIEALRDDVERAEARLRRLRARRGTPS